MRVVIKEMRLWIGCMISSVSIKPDMFAAVAHNQSTLMDETGADVLRQSR